MKLRSLFLLAAFAHVAGVCAQTWFSTVPKYPDYRQASEASSTYNRLTNVTFRWAPDSKGFYYNWRGGWIYQNVVTGEEREAKADELPRDAERPVRQGIPRATSAREAVSPDGKVSLVSDGFNITLKPKEGVPIPVTTEGGANSRLQFGAVSWVYGEELAQRYAMGWSPKCDRFWYYKFNNNPVIPYFLLRNNSSFRNEVDRLDYPKAGDPNPEVTLYVAEYPSLKTVALATTSDPDRSYIYRPEFSRDGQNLYFLLANRLQNKVSLESINMGGGGQTLWVESVPDGYVPNSWEIGYPSDSDTTLFKTERNGFANFVELDLAKGRSTVLTDHQFESESVVRNSATTLIYTARSGENPHYLQYHWLDKGSKKDVRLTNPHMHHQLLLSPNGSYAIDISETPMVPTRIDVMEISRSGGKVLRGLRESEMREAARNLQVRKLFSFKSADGKFDLTGVLELPAGFSRFGRYPMLVSVYNGPESVDVSPNFGAPDSLTGLGCVIAHFETRGGGNRGSAFRSASYRHLGVAEIDDLAKGVEAVLAMGFVDPERVGIYGTSYGGYTSTMAILRYPDLFQAAVACSSVIDWRHYDTIYTERYMGLPQDNKEGYDAGSAVTYAKQLKGHLLLWYGMRDDNVHPNNTMQLLEALKSAGKFPDVSVGPHDSHSFIGMDGMMHYFWQYLDIGK